MIGIDGQFVAVTLAAGWGGWVLLRPLLALRRSGKQDESPAACAHCASGASCAAKRPPGAEAPLVTLGGSRQSSRP